MTGQIRATKVFSGEREIVVGVDGSEYSRCALDWAVREAKLRDAVLRAICVAPIGSDDAFDWTVDDAMERSTKIVDDAVVLAGSLEPTVVVRGEVPVGSVAETLAAASEVAELLVVGARGNGAVREFLLGSVSRSCAQRARCPVVIVHTMAHKGGYDSPQRIVVEVDASLTSDALHWAVEEAALRSAKVEPVFDCATSHDNDATQRRSQVCDDMADTFTQLTSSYIAHRERGLFGSRARCTSTVTALRDACQGADLLVVSEVSSEGISDRARGSIVRQCAHQVQCPVVVLGPSVPREDSSRSSVALTDGPGTDLRQTRSEM